MKSQIFTRKNYYFFAFTIFFFITISLAITSSSNLFADSLQDNSTKQIIIPKNKYGLEVVDNINIYNQLVKLDSNNKLVDLEKFIPKLKLCIRYATKNNFTKTAVYTKAKVFARLPVAKAIYKIQKILESKGYGLIIFDAYRPYSITLKFWDLIKDTNFVAAPWTGSRHNRGCAVDVSIYNLKTGKEIQMPSSFDDFTNKAFPTNNNFSKAILNNRKMLIDIMTANGFTVYPTEWWHFDFQGYEKFNLMDISFDLL
jgi:D-alanyl-D-alanine dipeptidase